MSSPTKALLLGLVVAALACKERAASGREATPGAGQQGAESTRMGNVQPMTFRYSDTSHFGVANPADAEYTGWNAWIWFATSGDSIDMSVSPPADRMWTSAGMRTDEQDRDPAYFRHQRASVDGVVAATAVYDDGAMGETKPYDFVVRTKGSSRGPLAPTGGFATLIVQNRAPVDSFSIVPLSIANSLRDRSAWRVYAQSYKVALVGDSLYEVCHVPCTKPDTVKLRPGTTVSVRFD